jgi:hypothetical protein
MAVSIHGERILLSLSFSVAPSKKCPGFWADLNPFEPHFKIHPVCDIGANDVAGGHNSLILLRHTRWIWSGLRYTPRKTALTAA